MAQLTYRSPLRTPERILTFGVQGTGKSEAPLTIAEKIPDATFHVIDTDYSESYARALDTTYSHLSNIIVHRADPDDWEAMNRLTQEVVAEVGPADWFVFDSMTPTWDAVQSWFIEQVHGDDIADYYLDIRVKKAQNKSDKKGSSLGGIEGWMDWPVINAQYNRFYGRLLKCRGHLYLTAEQTAVADEDGKDVKGTFGPYGVKPKGQKKLGHVPHTVLWCTKKRAGDYSLTTIKDRNRDELEDSEIGNFAKDYLVKIAGWKPGKVA